MRWPASRLSRAATSDASTIWRVSKRNCAAVESLLTFCAPGPEQRTYPISISFSSIFRSRKILSMASPADGNSPNGNRPAEDSGFVRSLSGSSLPNAVVRNDSVRRGRGRSGGLGGGLRGAADDHGEQALPPQAPGGAPGVIERDSVDDAVALLDVVDRELVQLVLQQRRRQLRGGVQRQHLRALEIGLGLVQFLLGRAILGHAADFLVDGLDGLAGAVGAGSGISDEQRGVIHPQQRFKYRIGQPALLADFVVEPRRQRSAAENVVDDIAGHEIRI